MASHADVTANLIRMYSSLLGDEYSGMHNVFTSKRLCRYDDKGMAVMSTRELVESQARHFTEEMGEVEKLSRAGGDVAAHFKGKLASSGRIMFTHSKDVVKTAWENKREIAAAVGSATAQAGKQTFRANAIAGGLALTGTTLMLGTTLYNAHAKGVAYVDISKANANATNATPAGLTGAVEFMASSPTLDPLMAAQTPEGVLGTHLFHGASMAGTDPSVFRALRQIDNGVVSAYQTVIESQPLTPERASTLEFRKKRKLALTVEKGGGAAKVVGGVVGFGGKIATAKDALVVIKEILPGTVTRSGAVVNTLHATTRTLGTAGALKTTVQAMQGVRCGQLGL